MGRIDSERGSDNPRNTTENQPLTLSQPESNQRADQSTPDNPKQDGKNNGNTAKELAREFRWVEWATVIINGGLAVIGIIALCVYNGQLKVMRGQLDQMATDGRPWIKITDVTIDTSIPPTPALSFMPFPTSNGDAPFINLRTEVSIKNIGRGVAQNVYIMPAFVFETGKETQDAISPAEKRTCESYLFNDKPAQSFSWSALFPGDEVKYRLAVGGPFITQTIIKGNYLIATLIDCISYQFPLHYQTRSVFHVMGAQGKFIEVNKNLSPSQVRLLRDEHYEYAQ